jgi:hypothetical protein
MPTAKNPIQTKPNPFVVQKLKTYYKRDLTSSFLSFILLLYAPYKHKIGNNRKQQETSMHTSLRISIRLSPSEVTSISLKTPVVVLWAMLGSQRDYITRNGIKEDSSPSLYALTYRALSDFAFKSISKYFKNLSIASPNSTIIEGKKGLSDFVLNAIMKDIIKNSLDLSSGKDTLIKYTPKDYATMLKCIERGS